MPRDTMITAIDLKNCLGRGESEKKGLFIVTNFNKLDIAFHVESVLGIHRVSWRDIINRISPFLQQMRVLLPALSRKMTS